MVKAVVVGAGIVGVCAGLYLQRDGHDVTIVDYQEPGSGCSYGNSGLMAPGYCVPLAMPGIATKVPFWHLKPDGPLCIRWSHFPHAIPWLFRFLMASRADRVPQYATALRSLHRGTFDDYAPLVAAAHAENLLSRTGELCVYEDDASFADDDAALRLQRSLNVDMQVISGAEAREVEPHLAPTVVKGVLYPDAGHCINPGRLVTALAASLVNAGGVIRKLRVRDFTLSEGLATNVLTDGETIQSDLLVIAAGSRSGEFVRRFGDRVALEPLRGYHAVFTEPGFTPALPVHSAGGKFTATPMEMGIRCGGTIEIAGHDAPPDYRRGEMIARQVRRLYPSVNATAVEFWAGHRPCTPDSLPVIDRAGSIRNVLYAFGHGSAGLLGAATTGRLIADLAAGRNPISIDLEPFRHSRFVR